MHIILLLTIGFFDLVGTASAQPVARFDGTYEFVSGTALSKTWIATWTARPGRCGNPRYEGSITIANGQAQYTSATGFHLEGTVGSQGELVMRSARPVVGGFSEIITTGMVEGAGIVHARQLSNRCSYDLFWRKVS